MRVDHDERQLRLRVHRMQWEAEGVVSLTLRSTDGGDLPPWAGGAHIDLHLPGGVVRQYSLCGDPAERDEWRVAVLREVASRGGSKAVHEQVRPGDVLQVVGPRNNFQLVTAPRYLFIAGGIGITPLLPMIGAASQAGAEWELLYGGRSIDSMAFRDELAGYGDQVTVRPEDVHGLLDLPTFLGDPDPDTLIYCCGPEPLIGAVENIAAPWPSSSLQVERFAPKVRDDQADPSSEQAFELMLERSGITLTVQPDQSVLQAMEAAGLEPLSSCREGICGTCEATVIEGVPDHRDSLLDDEEKAANETMMVCVGRSLTPTLVLDL